MNQKESSRQSPDTDAEVVIRVENLRQIYRVGFLGRPKLALDGASFEVGKNEIFGYIGANGAGKTTTIKILVGLQRPTAGKATVMGTDVSEAGSRRRLGFLPENPYFYEYLTAREALTFYGQLCDVPARELAARSASLLALVQLEHAADRPIRGYSKGMRQRLGLAQALVNDPEVVILDEPMSGLDPLGRAQVREIILELGRRGKTVFFSSHILGDVEAICSRVCLIDSGQVKAIGSLSSLLRREVKSVDLITLDLPEELARELEALARHHHADGAERSYSFADEETAQTSARKVLDAGGRVRALVPHLESLEDVFLDNARAGSAGAGAQS